MQKIEVQCNNHIRFELKLVNTAPFFHSEMQVLGAVGENMYYENFLFHGQYSYTLK